MKFVLLFFIYFTNSIRPSTEVTTIHHDKPEGSNIHIMASTMGSHNKQEPSNITLTPTERQKRLLPYINFYQTQPVYENPQPKRTFATKPKYTPFTESNVSPGTFKPILAHPQPQRIKIQYVSAPQNNKYSSFFPIYDKLSLLKLTNSENRSPNYVQLKPQSYNKQKLVEPSIETYTPTTIDIDSDTANYGYETPHPTAQAQENFYRNPYPAKKKPFIIVSANQDEETDGKRIIVVQTRPVQEENHISSYPLEYNPPRYETLNYEPFPKYQSPPQYEPQTPNYVDSIPPVKNPISLSLILKYLQATNALPKTLTPDNIDNSIKTLVKILNILKKQQKLAKPIQEEYLENEAGVDINEQPGIISEHFPEDTEEGGTPGKPGIDYPALSSIPQTSFNCKTQRYKGFFGDPDTHCQVWHYCDLNGGQASFLCPNGTIFSQVALTCDWWYNVKCASTAQLYVLNERLYKYIIPLSPKFPEDYTGPLVDKYLALKFQEMEDKMRKEKKAKGNKTEVEKNTPEGQGNDTENTGKFIDTSTSVSFRKETLETVENDNQNN